MKLPSKEVATQRRREHFKDQIHKIIDQENLNDQYRLLEQYQEDWGLGILEISAALLKLVQAQGPALMENVKAAPAEASKPRRAKFGAKNRKIPKQKKKKSKKPKKAKKGGKSYFK